MKPILLRPLPLTFYLRNDVVQIARDLLGKSLFSTIGGELTGGIITETEAYQGPDDMASHAYNNRRTMRTEVMFAEGGISYVYLCYGIHCLLNVVTNRVDIPHAVLIRALFPTHGIEIMEQRRKRKTLLCNGPGALAQALGIQRLHNGLSLAKEPLWIEDRGLSVEPEEIRAGPRVGIEYAKEHALLPWRFTLDPRHNSLASSKSDRVKL